MWINRCPTCPARHRGASTPADGSGGSSEHLNDTLIDYLVIGAGPAGLQLGYFLERAGRDYLILEAGAAPGKFFRTFPRHRRLISINKPHTGWDDPELNLRMDWNSLLSDDPRPALHPLQRALLPGRRRPGPLPGRLRRGASPARALRRSRRRGIARNGGVRGHRRARPDVPRRSA